MQNARSQQDNLRRHEVFELPHTIYSHDCAYCEFLLFPKLQEALSCMTFQCQYTCRSVLLYFSTRGVSWKDTPKRNLWSMKTALTSCISSRRFVWWNVIHFYKDKCFISCYCGNWDGWALVNQFNHTGLVDVVTQTDRPKSLRKRCVIEVFGGVFILSRCFLFFGGCRDFCHTTNSDLYPF